MATRTRITRRGRLVLVGLGALLLILLLSGLTGGGAAPLVTSLTAPPKVQVVEVFTGEATFYGPGLPADAVTASGAPFDPQGATAAHPTLEFGTMLRVSRLDGDAAVVVEVNDRLPDSPSTRVDLTLGAATVLGMVDEGRIPVQVEVLAPADR